MLHCWILSDVLELVKLTYMSPGKMATAILKAIKQHNATFTHEAQPEHVIACVSVEVVSLPELRALVDLEVKALAIRIAIFTRMLM